jgi:hypothetical protein
MRRSFQRDHLEFEPFYAPVNGVITSPSRMAVCWVTGDLGILLFRYSVYYDFGSEHPGREDP